LDRTLFWTTVDLENKLLEFRDYYNGYRTHHSLEGRTLDRRTVRESESLSMARPRHVSDTNGCAMLRSTSLFGVNLQGFHVQ